MITKSFPTSCSFKHIPFVGAVAVKSSFSFTEKSPIHYHSNSKPTTTVAGNPQSIRKRSLKAARQNEGECSQIA